MSNREPRFDIGDHVVYVWGTYEVVERRWCILTKSWRYTLQPIVWGMNVYSVPERELRRAS